MLTDEQMEYLLKGFQFELMLPEDGIKLLGGRRRFMTWIQVAMMMGCRIVRLEGKLFIIIICFSLLFLVFGTSQSVLRALGALNYIFYS